jgi:predicted transport protein
MANLEYVKHKQLSMRSHQYFNELWLQDRIAEDPSILGLGNLILRDRERIQPRSGRLDLLLQDPEANLRYEVEIQLGSTDESHIIRTIEYWDIERKRYPQYDHVAVIAAEDITSRFLNVIGLFNGFIPLIAIQINAIEIANQVTLVATRVLDQMPLGPVDDEEDQEVVDRSYWEKRGTPATVEMADSLLAIAKTFDDSLEFKYNKFYIGLARYGEPLNFVILRPQKQALRMEPRLPRDDELETELESKGIDLMDYHTRNGRYRIRLTKGDIENNREFIESIMRTAFEQLGR